MTRKQEILENLKARNGAGYFLKDNNYTPFADLDGAEAKRYLESLGFEVVSNGDVMTHGYALTKEGVYLSTNGYISLKH